MQHRHERTLLKALIVILVCAFGVWIPLAVSTQTTKSTVLSEGASVVRKSDKDKHKESSSRFTTKEAQSSFAYAFVIGGCYPEDPAYRGFLYNVLISTRILHRVKTQADIVLYIQMSYKSAWDRLPEQDVVTDLGIRLIYLDTNPHESFYEVVLEKFRILQLVEYKRVLLLDADVMPFGNLDYHFKESVNGHWMENYVVTSEHEPANGGFFMLTPHQGDWDQLQAIVRQRELASAAAAAKQQDENSDSLLFDPVQGWGHVIEPPDYWETKRLTGQTNWTFNFAYSDQGLLYHWVKYVKKNVSIRINGRIHHWTTMPNGTLYWANTRSHLARFADPVVVDWFWCLRWGCDWAHFTSDGKPWMTGPPDVIVKNPQHQATNAIELWFTTLRELNQEYGLGVNFTHWSLGKRPTLGTFAGGGQVRAKTERTIQLIKHGP